MKTVTITKELYNYDELPEDIKEKVINNLYDINVDYNWWDFDGHTGFTAKEIKRYRLDINHCTDLLKFKEMYFDLDRGSYIQFVDAEFVHDETARKFLGIPKRLWEETNFIINDQPYRETNTRLEYEPGYARDYKDFTPKQEEILDRAVERFADKIHQALSDLRHEWEYRTSRKAIEETIECKEYTFNLDGEIDNG